MPPAPDTSVSMTLQEACVFLKIKYNLTFTDFKYFAEWLGAYQYLPVEGSSLSRKLQKVTLDLELSRFTLGRESPIGRAYRNLCMLDTAVTYEQQDNIATFIQENLLCTIHQAQLIRESKIYPIHPY